MNERLLQTFRKSGDEAIISEKDLPICEECDLFRIDGKKRFCAWLLMTQNERLAEEINVQGITPPENCPRGFK